MKPYSLNRKPLAKPSAMIVGAAYRFTVLSPCLIRMEYQSEGRFVEEITQTVICRDFPEVPFRVTLECTDSKDADVCWQDMAYQMLNRAQLLYELKEAVYNTLLAEQNAARLLGKLNAMDLPQPLLNALTEWIVAEY